MKQIIFYILLAVLTIIPIYGKRSTFSVRHYDITDGMAYNRVRSIIQDDKGYIWLGTWNGFDKFDGYAFKNFKSYPTHQVKLGNNRIEELDLNSVGDLWVRSYGDQVLLFNSRTEEFEDVFAGKQRPLIKEIICLDNGVTWMLSPNNELYRIDDNNYKQSGGIQFFGRIDNPFLGEKIYNIFMDSENDEWILTNKGIIIEGKKKISNNMPFHFILEAGRSIYLATQNGYLATYTNGQLVTLNLPVKFNQICNLKKLTEEKIAIISSHSVDIYDIQQKTLKHFLLPTDTEFVDVDKIFYDSSDQLWAFVRNKQILCYNTNTGKGQMLNYPDCSKYSETLKNSISFFHEDEFGEIWILLSEGILCIYNKDTKKLEIAYTGNSLSGQNYYTVSGQNYLIDTHKNIWISTRSGIDYLSFKKKSYEYISSSPYKKIQDTFQEEVRGIFQDSRKYFWLGKRNGKVEVYDETYSYIGNLSAGGKIIENKDVVFGASVYCFCQDVDGHIWLGTRERGLFVLTPESALSYKIKNYLPETNNPYSISSESIFSILQDSERRIWVGCYGGGINLVERKNNDDFRFIHAGNKLKNYPVERYGMVKYIYQSKKGVMLVGTNNGLITFLNHFKTPEEISFFCNFCTTERSDCLSNNDILNIFQSKNGNIYVSTFSGGIDITSDSPELLSDKVRFKNINKIDGLVSDLSLSVIEDGKGYIWISSVNAFTRLNPQTGHLEHFNKENLDLSFVISDAPPILDHSGNPVYGTVNGALRILIDQIQKSSFVPPIVFTDISIQGKDAQKRHKVLNMEAPVLSGNERNITISFASLDYSNSASIKYAYRLKDTNDDWITIGKNRSASFINLSSGHHIFQVKSTNSDGIWEDNTVSLPIYVTPTFWETGFAWIVYIGSTLLLIFIIVFVMNYIFGLRRQVNLEQELAQMKLKFFTDISHELRTPLTLIVNPIEEVLNNEPLSACARDHMNIARQNTNRMLRLINQILDFRRIQNNKMKIYLENTDIILLIDRVFHSFSSIAEQKQINYIFETNEDSYFIYTDVDKVEKILFNLLSNAFKHTSNGRSIELISQITENELSIKVKDEGVGFDISKIDSLFRRFETSDDTNPSVSSGIGLSLVKELVDLLHGSIEVDSRKGIGSVFSIKLPVGYEYFANDAKVELILTDNSNNKKEIEKNITREEEIIQKTSILIIEDNGELRHFICNILNKDYRIFEASNGKDGLDITLRKAPDIVLCDIMMPEMDGLEYLKQMKENQDISHIPVILLTAKSSTDDQVRGMEYGADDYIVKPFNSTYLKARIISLIKQRELLHNYYLQKMNFDIKQQKADQWEPSVPRITRYDDEFICRVIQDIENNIENPEFKIHDLAVSMNVSRPVFYRKIKSIVGLSPIDFVKRIRIKRAVQLLDTGQFSVAEVAYQSGFTTPQYLSKVFKDLMGCSPTEYKQKQQKEEL